MSAISVSKFIVTDKVCSTLASFPSSAFGFHPPCPIIFPKFPSRTQLLSPSRKNLTLVFSNPSEAEASTIEEDEWLKRLPDKKKPLYSHSLPCVEAWLMKLGFHQSKDDRALWLVEKPEWQAQLSLDTTDLYIRYLKSGGGKLEKDVERRFSYALSREDIENAILGGP